MSRVIQVNGSVRDTEGHALGGVLVSNGEHVVQTDRDGRYAIEAAPIPPAAMAEGSERGNGSAGTRSSSLPSPAGMALKAASTAPCLRYRERSTSRWQRGRRS